MNVNMNDQLVEFRSLTYELYEYIRKGNSQYGRECFKVLNLVRPKD